MKNKKILLFLLVTVLAGMMCLNGCGISREPENLQSEEEILQEDVSEEDEIQENPEDEDGMNTHLTGNGQGTFSTTDLQGNIVTQAMFSESELTVLNVWATYCGPCIQEMPYLGELSAEYDSTQVQIIGVPMDVYNEEYLAYANQLITETGADYTHLLLSQELYDWGLYDIQYVPTTFFVNKEGEVVNSVVGSFSKEDWKKMIDEQLASM